MISYILKRASPVETAQVNPGVDAIDDALVAKLPQYPLGPKVELRLTLGVASYEQRIVPEVITKQGVEVAHIGVNHGFAAIVVF